MSRAVLVLCSILAVLFLEVLGQSEFITNGKSGPSCGKASRKCLSNAKCNKREGVCHCKRQLVGNGKLGCFRPGDAVAFLLMDPNLKTFDDDYLNIATPCRYKVVHYTLLPSTLNGARASAEVYAKNVMSQTGEYYVMNVLVIISVMTETKVGKYSVLLEGTEKDGEYTFISTVLEDSMTKSSLILQMDFTKYFISVSVDRVNNFLVARSDGVGLTVRFRPPSTPLEGVQKMVPGVSMVIDREVVDSVKFVNGTLSSSPYGPSITSQASSLGLDLQVYVYLLAILNTPAIIMDDRMCQDTTIVFKNLCKTDETRTTLLKTCATLYLDKEFLTCLYEKRVPEQRELEHRLFFRYCVQAFCLQRVDICQAMVERIEATKCQLPSKLKDFKCSAEALRVTN